MMQEEQMTASKDGDDETPNQRAARKRKELEVPNPAPVQTQVPKEKKVRDFYTESLLFQCCGHTG